GNGGRLRRRTSRGDRAASARHRAERSGRGELAARREPPLDALQRPLDGARDRLVGAGDDLMQIVAHGVRVLLAGQLADGLDRRELDLPLRALEERDDLAERLGVAELAERA